MNQIKPKYKRLIFYWLTSFFLATSSYYLLWLIIPEHYVFGALYRMFTYHWQHPVQYIIIPCFFYGLIANLFAENFSKSRTLKRVLLTGLIIILTILLSSPFGGMLWHLHDMQAGYFPADWLTIMITEGISWGLPVGWLIIGLSVPYNIFGSIACYFLTRKGVELYET